MNNKWSTNTDTCQYEKPSAFQGKIEIARLIEEQVNATTHSIFSSVSLFATSSEAQYFSNASLKIPITLLTAPRSARTSQAAATGFLFRFLIRHRHGWLGATGRTSRRLGSGGDGPGELAASSSEREDAPFCRPGVTRCIRGICGGCGKAPSHDDPCRDHISRISPREGFLPGVLLKPGTGETARLRGYIPRTRPGEDILWEDEARHHRRFR